jgi:hypothetical protein
MTSSCRRPAGKYSRQGPAGEKRELTQTDREGNDNCRRTVRQKKTMKSKNKAGKEIEKAKKSQEKTRKDKDRIWKQT